MSHMTRKLGNGEDSSLVFDRWLIDTSDILIQYLLDSQMPTDIHKLVVSDIVDYGNWLCKLQFLQPIWHLIVLQPVPVSSTTDTWFWTCTDSGEFRLNVAWNLVRDAKPKYEFSDIIWYPNHSPKMSTYFLRALHSKLLTIDFS